MSNDNSPIGSDADAEQQRAAASHSSATSDPGLGEKLYRLLFDLLPTSVVLLDARGFVLDANPSFCQQIGYSRGKLLGLHVSRLSQDSVETIERNISRLMAGEVLEHQVTNVQKDGSLRHYELREAAITLPDGSRGILALSNDITERLHAQQEKQEIERHLLYAEKLKGLGVMAGGIAHDFNNLHATILTNLELTLLDLEMNSSLQTNLQEAFNAANRAAELTRQMLAYSGRGKFDIKDVDLSALIQRMTGLLEASVSKHARIEFHLLPDLPFIAGDAGQLQQITVNLVTNAAEAIGEGAGNITITTCLRECDSSYLARSRAGDFSEPGRYVVLEVRDTGCGMDESVQERLFDPFFTSKFAGRGLGMSAVMGIVRGHNGAIFVNSKPGKGTTITVLFPALANLPSPSRPSSG